MRFLLGAADRARYGLGDDPVEVDLNRLMLREADLMEVPEPAGPGISAEDWYEVCLRGDPVEESGVPLIDEETGKQVRRWNRRTMAVMFWLGARRAGASVAWAEWDFDMQTAELVRDPDPEPAEGGDGEGKALPGGPPSPSGDGS